MQLTEFRIGGEFTCGGNRWRVTDIGTRTVVAIRIDRVAVELVQGAQRTRRTLDTAEADAAGWFNGPPYAVVERVFDEDMQPVCAPA